MTQTMLSRVTATWRPGLVPPESEQPEPVERYERVTNVSAVAATWRAPDSGGAGSAFVMSDAETVEVLAASGRTRDALRLDHRGMSWPGALALEVDHRRPPVGFFTSVDYDGQTFSFAGWAEPEAYADLRVRQFISPGFRIAEARWSEEYGAERHGVITRADVVELSAVVTPLLTDTTFTVRPPVPVKYTLEFLAFSAERLSVVFPASIERF